MLIGRKDEIQQLNRLYDDSNAQLIAVYGRRRVGKTFLINNVFQNKMTFSHTGLNPEDTDTSKSLLSQQLQHFYNSLIIAGMSKTTKPKNWLEAFMLLELFLMKKDNGQRQVVFLDELPWMDTPQSHFIQAFEAFWNSWACSRNIIVIVCGSATSWMQNKLINNYGGLYNRVTYQIELNTFTLKECEEFIKQRGINYSRYDITQAYMIFGGVPHYLSYLQPNLSLAQNIDKLFFQKNAILRIEYDRLFKSIFSNPERVKNIIEFLFKKNVGFTRTEILAGIGMSDGEVFNDLLNSLVASNFISKHFPFSQSKRQPYYKLTDPFCLFYLSFVKDKKTINEAFWQNNSTSSTINSWRGISFENVCFNHIKQIKKALDIGGVITEYSAWSKKNDDNDGMQIDLVISRNDNVVNMCEIKFYSSMFKVNKEFYLKLLERQNYLSEKILKKQSVFPTLITTFGIEKNEYSNIFTNVITLDELFL